MSIPKKFNQTRAGFEDLIEGNINITQRAYVTIIT